MKDCFLALDPAATEFMEDGRYHLRRDNINLNAEALTDFYRGWSREFHIISIEDGLGEDDWPGWRGLCDSLGRSVQLVGDDLYTTNRDRIRRGIQLNASNAVLLKLNQAGTVTETIEAFEETRKAGWGAVVSHRSGETEDTTIADLAVALGTGQIKAGAPCRSERLAKYNRLLRIEEELGEDLRSTPACLHIHIWSWGCNASFPPFTLTRFWAVARIPWVSIRLETCG